MNPDDKPRLATMLEEVCAMFGKPYSGPLLNAYYRTLIYQEFDAVSRAMITLLGDDQRRQVMPTAAEIKALAKHSTPSRQRDSIEDERWRRRYDVWMRGSFTDEAMEKANAMTDGELGVEYDTSDPQSYIRCQQPRCASMVPWPNDRRDEGRMYCPNHQPMAEVRKPVTSEEKQAILARATPAAKAFLRSIDVIARHMTDIPITAAEQEAADAATHLMRPVAFKDTAEGPGVNPSIFLQGKVTEDANWMRGYQERRAIVRTGGYKFDMEQAVWKRGRQMLTEEQIDGFPDVGLLESFVGRRAGVQ